MGRTLAEIDAESRRFHDALQASGVEFHPSEFVQCWGNLESVELDGSFSLTQLEAIVAAMKATEVMGRTDSHIAAGCWGYVSVWNESGDTGENVEAWAEENFECDERVKVVAKDGRSVLQRPASPPV